MVQVDPGRSTKVRPVLDIIGLSPAVFFPRAKDGLCHLEGSIPSIQMARGTIPNLPAPSQDSIVRIDSTFPSSWSWGGSIAGHSGLHMARLETCSFGRFRFAIFRLKNIRIRTRKSESASGSNEK